MFNKKDLVEIADELSPYHGKRFRISTWKSSKMLMDYTWGGRRLCSNVYKTDFKDLKGVSVWVSRKHLRKVNTDGDHLSAYSFGKLMTILRET